MGRGTACQGKHISAHGGITHASAGCAGHRAPLAEARRVGRLLALVSDAEKVCRFPSNGAISSTLRLSEPARRAMDSGESRQRRQAASRAGAGAGHIISLEAGGAGVVATHASAAAEQCCRSPTGPGVASRTLSPSGLMDALPGDVMLGPSGRLDWLRGPVVVAAWLATSCKSEMVMRMRFQHQQRTTRGWPGVGAGGSGGRASVATCRHL